MARCNSCNKFVSYGDPEFGDVDVDATREDDVTVQVNGSVEMNLVCGECGDTLKTGTIDFEQTIDLAQFEVQGEGQKPEKLPEDADVNVDNEEPEASERSEGKGRYARKFYGFTMPVTVTVTVPGESDDAPSVEMTATINIADDMQASSFDEY